MKWKKNKDDVEIGLQCQQYKNSIVYSQKTVILGKQMKQLTIYLFLSKLTSKMRDTRLKMIN